MEQLFKVNKPNISLSVAVGISSLVLECTNDVEPRGMILAETTFALDRHWRFLVLHGTRDVKLLGRSRAPVDLLVPGWFLGKSKQVKPITSAVLQKGSLCRPLPQLCFPCHTLCLRQPCDDISLVFLQPLLSLSPCYLVTLPSFPVFCLLKPAPHPLLNSRLQIYHSVVHPEGEIYARVPVDYTAASSFE